MKKLVLSFIALFILAFSYAQPGTDDHSFNGTDMGNGYGDLFNRQIEQIIPLENGKTLVGGFFTRYNGYDVSGIALLNEDGTPDEYFQPGIGLDANGGLFAAALQPDGNIIIAGTFSSYDGVQTGSIARLYPNGTLDQSFIPGFSQAPIAALLVEPDGKIILGGNFFGPISNLVRLNADGSLDNTFVSTHVFKDGTNSSGISDIIRQPDGKLLVAGSFDNIDGTPRKYIARFHSDGTLDNSFNTGPGFNRFINGMSLLLQDDGKIIVGGSFEQFDGNPVEPIVRLTSTGTLDNTFAPSGIRGFVYSLAKQTDNKIVAGGAMSGSGIGNLLRINEDGGLDGSFESDAGLDGTVLTIGIQEDGKIFAGGVFSNAGAYYRNNIARFNTDGTVDESIFNTPNTGLNPYALAVAIQPDGQILAAGRFNRYNGVTRQGIVRMDSWGDIDLSFEGEYVVRGITPYISDLALQSDGKILISGLLRDGAHAGIARLETDGSYDNSFDIELGGQSAVYKSIVQSNDKIIIGGRFSSVNANDFANIARINEDGTTDVSFNPGTGANGTVYSLYLQPDGKILIGGNFTKVNEVNRASCARLNSDGSLDVTFNPFFTDNVTIHDIAVQPDGKIVLAGFFEMINGVTRNGIIRLNSDGSDDTSFYKGTGFRNQSNIANVLSVIVQPDGKLVAAGDFTTFDDKPFARIIRLNSDGKPDKSFNIGPGFDNTVYELKLADDGKIMAVGNFTSFNNTARNRIARILGGGIQTSALATTLCTGKNISIPYTSTGAYNFTESGHTFTAQLSDAEGNFSNPVVIGTKSTNTSGSIDATLPTTLSAGTKYRVRVVSSAWEITGTDNGSNIEITRLPLIVSGETSLCKGQSTQLTGSGAPSLFWINGPPIAVWYVSPEVNTTYTLHGSDLSGCYTDLPVEVIVKLLPTVTITGDDTICPGTSTTLTAQGASTYVWTDGPATAAFTVSPATQTEYSVTGTAANGCSNSAVATIAVFPAAPAANITADLTDPASPELTAGSATSYQWYKDGTLIGSATSQHFSPDDDGSYTVIIGDGNGCLSAASEAVEVVVTALEENSATAFSMYPNPAASHVMIQLKGFSDESAVNISVVDALGRVLNTQKVDGSTKELTMDVSEYRAGNYRVIFRQEKMLVSRQLVKR